MPSLEEHMDAAYELPPEWQQWLDAELGEGVEEIDHDHGTHVVDRLRPDTPWRIDNDHVATWSLRKLAAAEAEQKRVKDLAMAEIQRIEAWEQQELRRPTRDVDFFRGHLSAYWRRQMDALMAPYLERGMAPEEAWDEIKRKSLSLPTGKLVARRTPAGVEVVDEETFVRWAQENGYEELLRAKPALDAIKKLPVEDGVVTVELVAELSDATRRFPVPGVKVKPTEFRYDAKPDVDG